MNILIINNITYLLSEIPVRKPRIKSGRFSAGIRRDSSLDIENDIGYLNIKIAEGDKIKVEASNINERFFVKAQGHTLKIKNEEPSEKIFTKEERRTLQIASESLAGNENFYQQIGIDTDS